MRAIIILLLLLTTIHADKHVCRCNCIQPLHIETLANGKRTWSESLVSTSFLVPSCRVCEPKICPDDIGCTTQCTTTEHLSLVQCLVNWWNPPPDDSDLTTHPISERALVTV